MSICELPVTIPAVFAGHSPYAGATPNTNPQEGWHSGVKKVVVVSQRVPADRMIQEVFPNICENDCRWRHGEIMMEPPETLPSKFVECAKKLKDRGEEGYKVPEVEEDAALYAYVLQQDYMGQRVTEAWIQKFEEARQGRVPMAAYKYMHKCCFGLARVHQDEDRWICTCPDYFERLICPHIIFVMDLWGVRDLEAHTTALGRKKTRKGRLRVRRGALEFQPDTPGTGEGAGTVRTHRTRART